MQENKHHTTSRACGVCVYVEWGFQVDPCIFDNICLRGAKELWKMLYLKKKRLFSSPWKSDLWSTGHWFHDFRGHSLEVTGICRRMCLCMLACHHIHICVVIIMIKGIISIKFLQQQFTHRAFPPPLLPPCFMSALSSGIKRNRFQEQRRNVKGDSERNHSLKTNVKW